MSMWEEIAKIIGGGPMDQLPEQRTGVRPDYGLRGASIQESDLMDQLRNAERKEAAMPTGKEKLDPLLRHIKGRTIVASEPEIQAGMTRIYRGGRPGKWWTGNREIAEDFAHENATAGRDAGQRMRRILSYLDLPEEEAKKAAFHERVFRSAIPEEDPYYLPKRYWDLAQLVRMK